MPIADRSEWPKTVDGTTDWEALFENEETGIIAIVSASKTPQQLKQLTGEITRTIFNRKRDHTIIKKVTAYLNKLIPEDAEEERLVAMKAGVKKMLLKVKDARIRKAAAFAKNRSRHAKRKKSKKTLNRRANPVLDLFRRSNAAKAVLILSFAALLPLGIYLGSSEKETAGGDVHKHIRWISDYVYTHMPHETWILQSVRQSKDTQIAIEIQITDPIHIKAILGLKRIARVAVLNQACPDAGSGVKDIIDMGWSLWVALKSGDEILTGGTCHY